MSGQLYPVYAAEPPPPSRTQLPLKTSQPAAGPGVASCRWGRASPTESAEAAGREKAWSRRTEEDNATAARAALFLQDGSIMAKKRESGSKAAFLNGPFMLLLN